MGGDMESLVVRLPRDVLEGLRKWAEDEDRTMAQQVRRLIRQEMPAKFARPALLRQVADAVEATQSDEGQTPQESA